MKLLKTPFNICITLIALTLFFSSSETAAEEYTVVGNIHSGPISQFNNRALVTEVLPAGDYRVSIPSGAIGLSGSYIYITAISFKVNGFDPIYDIGALDIPASLQHQERYWDGVYRSPQSSYLAYTQSDVTYQDISLNTPSQIYLYVIDNLRGDHARNNTASLIVNIERLAIPVSIDIKPGSNVNPINLGAKGVIPVAIMTTDDFDASTVNPHTLTLAGAPVKVKGKSGNAGSLGDIDGDGDLDLVVQFYNTTDLQTGDPEAELTGYTYDGTKIIGTDHVTVMNPSNKSAGSISEPIEEISTHGLNPNFPNPFSYSTQISFSVPETEHVSIRVYNMNGKLVSILMDNEIGAGNHNIQWDGTDRHGNTVRGGCYICTFQSEKYIESIRMMLLE